MRTSGEPAASPSKRALGIVRQLSALVDELEGMFPGRPFTLDGHLVGSLGEILAAEYYGLELLPPGTATHDARASDGRLVQVKLTRRTAVALKSPPQHLLVLLLNDDTDVLEVYNGPGATAWDAAGPMQKNGTRTIGVRKLRLLMDAVPAESRVARRRH